MYKKRVEAAVYTIFCIPYKYKLIPLIGSIIS